MPDNLTALPPSPEINPNAVFAALDKVVAETTLATRLRSDHDPADAGATPDAVEDIAPAPAVVSNVRSIRPVAPPTVIEPPRAPAPAHAGVRPAVAPIEPAAVAHDATGQPPAARVSVLTIALAVAVAVAALEGWLLVRARQNTPAPAPIAAATLDVESTPAGATISIDGQAAGKTPSSATLKPGRHTLDVVSGSMARQVTLEVKPGTRHTEHFFLEAAPPGALSVTSRPAGARVTIDGAARGVTPLSISNLQAGSHAVVVDVPAAPARADAAPSPAPVVAAAATAGAGGWLTINSPITVQLFENNALLGSSESRRVMVPAGRHTIDLVNATLGFKATRTIQVAAGSTSAIGVEIPPAPVAINAVPWADVSVDGKAVGTTPLANISVPIGTHEFVFTHPKLGERRQSVVVSLKAPNRVTANMNQR